MYSLAGVGANFPAPFFSRATINQVYDVDAVRCQGGCAFSFIINNYSASPMNVCGIYQIDSGCQLLLQRRSAGNLEVETIAGSNRHYYAAVENGNPHHIAIIGTPSYIKVYVDGVCVATSGGRSFYGNGLILKAGADTMVSKFRVWNQALTDTQVAAVYQYDSAGGSFIEIGSTYVGGERCYSCGSFSVTEEDGHQVCEECGESWGGDDPGEDPGDDPWGDDTEWWEGPLDTTDRENASYIGEDPTDYEQSDTSSDYTCYRFIISADDTPVHIYTDNLDGDSCLWLYDSNGSLRTFDDDGNSDNENLASSISETLDAGTYYIKVAGYQYDGLSYTLHVNTGGGGGGEE